MKLSVKSDYAARAVLGLAAAHGSGEVRRVEDLARTQHVSPKYLVQILIELKSAGIVRSQRGKDGGYQLGRPPAEITLGDVIRAMHGEVFQAAALDNTNCPPELARAWRRLKSSIDEEADRINFQDLSDDINSREKMYYI